MENTQAPQQHPPMTPDRMKASMGIATMLQEQLLPKKDPQSPTNAPQTGQTPAQPTQPVQSAQSAQADDESGQLAKLTQEVAGLKAEIQKGAVNKEIMDIKQELAQLLSDENVEQSQNS